LDRLATGEFELLANDILGRRLVAHDGHNAWGAYKGAAVSTSVGQLGNLEGTQCKEEAHSWGLAGAKHLAALLTFS